MVIHLNHFVDFARRARRRKRQWRRRGCGCIWMILLLLVIAIVLLFGGIELAKASALQEISCQLVIDNSNSMYERGGESGADPDQLRLDAARLFVSYLGVDSDTVARCGILFFGDTVDIAAPILPLAEPEARERLLGVLSDAPRLGWTDPLLALEMAYAGLENDRSDRRVIVLLSDGLPQFEQATQDEAYAKAMVDFGQKLADAGIQLFAIQLDTNSQPDEAWQAVWQTMSQQTGGRHFFADRATALDSVYHDVVVALADRETEGAIASGSSHNGFRHTVEIEDDLAELTFVIRKTGGYIGQSPVQTVTVTMPNGRHLSSMARGVTHAVATDSEIWTVAQPQDGEWAIEVTGAGLVTVWLDYVRREPTPTVTPTVTPFSTSQPIETATLRSTVVQPVASKPLTTQPSATKHPTETPGVIAVSKVDDSIRSAYRQFVGALLFVSTLLGAAIVVSSVLWRNRNTNRLVLEGTLRIAEGHPFANGQAQMMLDGLRQTTVTIGGPASQLPLINTTDTATLTVEQQPDGSGHIMLVLDSESASIRRQRLYDRTPFMLGDTRLLYENVRVGRQPVDESARSDMRVGFGIPNP